MLGPMSASRFDPDAYTEALRFAAAAHAGQTVPGSDLPYLVHVVTVAAETIAALTHEYHPEPDLAVQCALLHDTVEDTAVTLDEVRARFGDAVADGVAALSKDPTLPKAERMADSLERIRAQPPAVWMVKLADRVTNLSAPPHYWPDAKREAYRQEAMLIGERLGEASAVLSGRLAERIDSYKAYIGGGPEDGAAR